MKLLVNVILLAVASPSYSQVEILMQDGITNPSLSLRCKDLHQERTEKVKVQQRLSALLQRSQDVLKKTPREKETVRARLNANQVKIKNELHLANLHIESMEENIIRSGCPGINLQ